MIKQVVKWLKKQSLRSRCIFDEKSSINLHTILEGANRIGYGAHFVNSKMGYGSYISDSCFMNGVSIGRYCCIGPNVRTALGRHPTRKYVSVHPSFFSARPIVGSTYVDQQIFDEIRDSKDTGYAVTIGNDVWVGASTTILDGVTIGNGAIIAAGAVVVSDVPDYAIVGGVPAKLIRRRFTDKEIEYLNSLKWWEKDAEWIKKYSRLFSDISMLMGEVNI